MRLSKTSYRCPYPGWLMLCSNVLPSFLAMAVPMLAWSETEQNAADLQKMSEWSRYAQIVFMATSAMIMFGFLLHVWIGHPLGREMAYLLLLFGSVYVAFRDGNRFGGAYTIMLAALLVPYYHSWFLSIRYAWPLRKKLRSLIGKEGKTIEYAGQFHMIVEINGEEYDAVPYYDGHTVQGLSEGVTVVVTGARMAVLEVEQKK